MGNEHGTHLSCIADTPLAGADDHLDAEIYARALADFIRQADTPLTIGIQGGWGSGKTSLFSLIRAQLQSKKGQDADAEDEEKQPVTCITVNAWEQSLFQSDVNIALVAMNLLQDILTKICELPKDPSLALPEATKKKIHASGQETKAVLTTIKRVFLATAQIGLTLLTQKDMSGALKLASTPEAPESESPAKEIRGLRKELAGLVEWLPAETGSPRLVIFIDDLDRVPPTAAVQILDVLKNIFNIPGCVFVLAIDYEVVSKGLEAKLGPRTGKNAHEFRQYLDKIIQVPFTMPTGSLSLNNRALIKELVRKLGLREFTGEVPQEETFKALGKIVRLAAGSNPRSIKRILNTVSLLEHIEKQKLAQKEILAEDGKFSGVVVYGKQADPTDEDATATQWATPMLSLECRFLIIALHICFPEICARLVERPFFPQWSKELDASWELNFDEEDKKITEIEKKSTLEIFFNEEWKKVVYCLCDKSDWLRHNFINVVKLLEHLKELLGLRATEDDNSMYNSYSRVIYAYLPFLENLRVLCTTYDSSPILTMDNITYFMRGIHEGLRKCHPNLQFYAPPNSIVAESVPNLEELSQDNEDDLLPAEKRIYTVKMKGGFEAFSVEYDENDIELKFTFSCSVHPYSSGCEFVKELMLPYADEPHRPEGGDFFYKCTRVDEYTLKVCIGFRPWAGACIYPEMMDQYVRWASATYEVAAEIRAGLLLEYEDLTGAN